MSGDTERDGVKLTHLDQPLFDGADATKQDLIDYLDAVRTRILPVLRDRPLSVMRIRPGQEPFVQKNLPKYAPGWIPTTEVWADASRRTVTYPLANDWRTLLWFANQRAVEYHPALALTGHEDRPTHLILDIDPPAGDDFTPVVQTAHLVRRALAGLSLAGAVKTSGSKGVHIFVPLDGQATMFEVAAATRAIGVRAERLDPALATTAFIREDRAGKVFIDSTRPAASPWPPPTARGSGPASRCRSRCPGATWTTWPRPTSPSGPCPASWPTATATRGPS